MATYLCSMGIYQRSCGQPATPVSFDQFNIGPLPHNEANVTQLADCVCDYWGSGVKPDLSPAQSDLYEAELLKLDISKAIKKLDWTPKLGFEQSVKLTVDWYKAESEGRDMFSVTQQQIDDYFIEV